MGFLIQIELRHILDADKMICWAQGTVCRVVRTQCAAVFSTNDLLLYGWDGWAHKDSMGLLPNAILDGFSTLIFCSARPTLFHGQNYQRSLYAQRRAFKTPLETRRLLRNSSSIIPATVHVGTTYENLCLRVLGRLGFSLTRTGGKSDKGIDLLGVWEPPVPTCASSTLRVIIQCKAHAGQVQPALIRELEGAVAGAPGQWRNDDTIAVLCTPKGATGGIRDAMRMAERGIVWVTVEETLKSGKVETQAKITQLLWNDCVRRVVADGLGTGLRFLPNRSGMEQEVVLMLNGRVWQPKQTTVA